MGPLRICHIASGDGWGGAEVQIACLLKLLKGFPALELSAILLNGGKLYNELLRNGVPTQVYDEGQLNTFSILRSLRDHLEKWRPDIVHTHRYKENMLGGIASSLTGRPMVLQTIHGLEESLSGWKRVKMSLYALINEMATKLFAQGIICVSQEIADVASRKYPHLRTVRIHNGIDIDAVRPLVNGYVKRKELGISEQAFIIGTACRLTPVKGIKYLLRAMSVLCQTMKVEAVKLVIVGDGPLRSQLEQLARQLGIDQQTLFLGARNDVYDLMAAFDVYVLPSLHEGIPLALLEAMCLSRSVVASNVGGIPEVLEDRVSGRLVPSKDERALANVLRELLDSPQLRLRYGQVGRERIVRDFDARLMASRTRSLYLSLTGRSLEA